MSSDLERPFRDCSKQPEGKITFAKPGIYVPVEDNCIPVPSNPNPNPKQHFADLKPPLHLWPMSATIAGSMAFREGAHKYGPFNWRDNPVEAMTYVGALLRHMAAYVDGEDVDPASGNLHLGSMLACIAILVDATACGSLIDNRPSVGPASWLIRNLTDAIAAGKHIEETYGEGWGAL